LPVGIALTATAYVATAVRKEPRLGTWCLACALLGAGLHLGTTVCERHALARPRADRYMQDYEDWHDVCEWIANHIDKGPTFLTPRRSQTFKWYTGHAEVVNFKDIPQDAPGIVEWWERIDSIHRYDDGEQRSFRPRLALQGTERLLEVGRKYRAEYLVTTVSPRLRFDWLYRNDTYVVYQLPRE